MQDLVSGLYYSNSVQRQYRPSCVYNSIHIISKSRLKSSSINAYLAQSFSKTTLHSTAVLAVGFSLPANDARALADIPCSQRIIVSHCMCTASVVIVNFYAKTSLRLLEFYISLLTHYFYSIERTTDDNSSLIPSGNQITLLNRIANI